MLCQHPWGGKQLWQPLLQCLTLNLYKKGFRSTISWILKKYWLENALANSKHNHSALVDLGRLLQNLCMYPVLHSSNFHQTYKEKSTRKYHMNNVLENDGLWNNHMIQVGYVFLCYYTYTHKLVYFLLCTIPGTCSVNPKIIRHTFFLTSLGTAGIWCYCVGCKKNCCTLTSSQISGL